MCDRLLTRVAKFVALVVVVSLAAGASAENKLAAFMKAKLDHSEKVLEGLAREDYALIAKHSQTISLLCEDELWSVIQTPEYLERSNEFRRSVNAITDAARKKNLDAAAFDYVESTMKCVTCHKYIRRAKEGR